MSSILIVAKPYEAEVVRKACADLGHEARLHDEGGEIVDCVEQHHPDLVVISTRAGDGEAARLLSAMREHPHGRSVPVLVLADEEDEHLEAERVITRPVSSEQLVVCIGEALSNGTTRAPSLGEARRRINARYGLVLEGDYFTLLDLPLQATAEDVDLAHQRLSREFDAEQVAPDLARECASELTEIREVLDEARAVLGQDTLRLAYRERLEGTE